MHTSKLWLRWLLLVPVGMAVLVLVTGVGRAPAAGEGAAARGEIDALCARVPGFHVVNVGSEAGTAVLTNADSLTVDDLRGVALDDAPPVMQGTPPAYTKLMGDDIGGAAPPYQAPGISPFRFRYFNVEFNWGGYHTWDMMDYAAMHGFAIINGNRADPATRGYYPAGTQWLAWHEFIDYQEWMTANGMKWPRWDQLADAGLADRFTADNVIADDPSRYQVLMVDQERWYLSPASLRQQFWYPKGMRADEAAAYEQKYYDGYAASRIALADAARRRGFTTVALYGICTQPFERTWPGLESVQVDPATDWRWRAFVARIYDAYDILNISTYAAFWSPRNAAHVLANIDFNQRFVDAAPVRKPIRPYYRSRIVSIPDGAWADNVNLPTEDMRAITALNFFTGADGMDAWEWTGSDNFNKPLPPVAGAVVQANDDFACADDDGRDVRAFHRYDALYVVAAGAEVVFQPLDMTDANATYDPAQPTYTLPAADFTAHLRPIADAFAGIVEGLALVKPLEYGLRHGAVKIDVPAQQQFANDWPIVRRVKIDDYHILATYDPYCVFNGAAPRRVTLADFDGIAGLTLTLPADGNIRLFVVSTAPDPTRRPDLLVTDGSAATPYLGNNVYNDQGLGQAKSQAAAPGETVTFLVRMQNDGSTADTFALTAAPQATLDGFAVQVVTTVDSQDVSSQTLGDGWVVKSLPPTYARHLFVRVTIPDGAAPGNRCVLLVTATSQAVRGRGDTVRLTVDVLQRRMDALIRAGETGDFVGDNLITPTGEEQQLTLPALNGAAAVCYVLGENDGNGTDGLRITAPAGGGGWSVRYYSAQTGAEMTGQVTGPGWTISGLPPGLRRGLYVKVTPGAGLPAGATLTVPVTLVSTGDPLQSDVALATFTVMPRLQPDALIRLRGETVYTGNNLYGGDGSGQTKSLTVAPYAIAQYLFRAQNDGNLADTLTVLGSAGGAGGWTVTYYDSETGADITADVTGSGWTPDPLVPAGWRNCYALVTPTSAVPPGDNFTLTLRVRSEASGLEDVVTAVTVRK